MKAVSSSAKKKLAVIVASIGVIAAISRVAGVWGVIAKNVYPGRQLSFTAGDWLTVANETRKDLQRKSLTTLAAGVAYFSALALFPFMAAAVAIAALLITPDQLQVLGDTIEAYLPGDVSGVITPQLGEFVSRRSDNSLVAVVALAVALFSASGATRNLVIATNVVYGTVDSRRWLTRQLWGVAWIVAVIGFSLAVVALLSVSGAFLSNQGVPSSIVSLLLMGRWLVIFLLTVFGLGVFYRYGPDRPGARWQLASWGATIAATVWIVSTMLFFFYIQNFANFAQTYSVFAGIIILMIWLNLSALIVLLGAEVNHHLDVVRRNKLL